MDKVDHLLEYRDMEGELIHATDSLPFYDHVPGMRMTFHGKEYEVIERFLKNGKRRFWWSFGFRFDAFYYVVYIDEAD